MVIEHLVSLAGSLSFSALSVMVAVRAFDWPLRIERPLMFYAEGGWWWQRRCSCWLRAVSRRASSGGYVAINAIVSTASNVFTFIPNGGGISEGASVLALP